MCECFIFQKQNVDSGSRRSETEIRAVARMVAVDVQWRIQGLQCVDGLSAAERPLDPPVVCS